MGTDTQHKPASVPSQPAQSALPAVATKKQWVDMTKAERDIDKATKLQGAISAVKKGARNGIPFKIGEFTMTARPSGVTEKGSMTYSYPPQVIMFEGQQLRINRFSVSLLGAVDAESSSAVDWDHLTATTD